MSAALVFAEFRALFRIFAAVVVISFGSLPPFCHFYFRLCRLSQNDSPIVTAADDDAVTSAIYFCARSQDTAANEIKMEKAGK